MEMRKQYRHFFGFEKDPFAANISTKDISRTPQLTAAESRFEYAANLGAVYLITGEIRSNPTRDNRLRRHHTHWGRSLTAIVILPLFCMMLP